MSDHVVSIDNTSSSDNWIVNTSDINITVACDQGQGGKFSVNLQPGERKRVAWNVSAHPYPYGLQKYDDFEYSLNKSETWEVRKEAGKLILFKVS